jgi:hypothetical protein
MEKIQSEKFYYFVRAPFKFFPSISLSGVSSLILFQLFATWGKICQWCKFSADVIDTGIRWGTLTCKYLCNFSKKFHMTVRLFSGAWGKMIHEKNLKQKISPPLAL